MGYVSRTLNQGEQVAATGQLHWWIYAKPAGFGVLGVLFLLAALGSDPGIALIGLGLLGVALFLGVEAYIRSITTELAVTNLRVIAKFGFIRRHTTELNHSKVEGFSVDQSILGRILNFGTVTVTGTGGMAAPIPYIRDPLAFRRAAMEAIDRTQRTHA